MRRRGGREGGKERGREDSEGSTLWQGGKVFWQVKEGWKEEEEEEEETEGYLSLRE